MGKGDQRSGRGKIFAGSHGKTNPSPKVRKKRSKRNAAKKGKK